jgi:protein tyrosine phosphatase
MYLCKYSNSFINFDLFSDGVGRTGTYILLDIVLNRIYKGAREINIAATLEHIRDQRAKMVKTKVILRRKIEVLFLKLLFDLGSI